MCCSARPRRCRRAGPPGCRRPRPGGSASARSSRVDEVDQPRRGRVPVPHRVVGVVLPVRARDRATNADPVHPGVVPPGQRDQVGLAAAVGVADPHPVHREHGAAGVEQKPSSVTSAHSRPLLPNQRWCGIHSRSRSVGRRSCSSSGGTGARPGSPRRRDHARRQQGVGDGAGALALPVRARRPAPRPGQLEPVEAVPRQREHVGEHADLRELDPAGSSIGV